MGQNASAFCCSAPPKMRPDGRRALARRPPAAHRTALAAATFRYTTHPRGTRDPPWRAEPAIDAGPREPRGITRPTPARRRPDPPVRLAPLTPRDHAGTFGVDGHATGTSDGSPTGSATHVVKGPARRSRGAHGARARSKARREGHEALARSAIAQYAQPPPVE